MFCTLSESFSLLVVQYQKASMLVCDDDEWTIMICEITFNQFFANNKKKFGERERERAR